MLVAAIDAGEGLPDAALHAHIAAEFRHFAFWVEGLGLCAKICLYTRWFTQSATDFRAEDVDQAEAWLTQLRVYAEDARSLANDSRIPHQRIMLVDPRRACDIVREGEAIIRSVRR